MPKFPHAFSIGVFLIIGAAATGRAQSDPGAVKLVKRVGQKYAAAKQYAFEGALDVGKQKGEDPRQELAKAKVKLEAAPGGKFRLHITNENDKSEYSVISDGRKTWTYVPALAQYSEQDAPQGKVPAVKELEKGDIAERFSKQIMPLLTGIEKMTQISFVRGSILTVLSKKDAQEHQTLAYLTVNSDTLAIPKMIWIQTISHDEKIRADFTFTDFRINNQIPDSVFSFTPPEGAKRVDALPVPGQAGPAQ